MAEQKATNITWHEGSVSREERQKLVNQKGVIVWMTGLSASGKSTIACILEQMLLHKKKQAYRLDGDNIRMGLNKNLGFSAEDRAENIRRIGEVSKLFVDAGVNVNEVHINFEPGITETTGVGYGPHVALGARRAVSETNDLGVRLELDEVDGRLLMGVRPVDYRHRFTDSFAFDLFAGVNRYDVATPAYSVYAGLGGQWLNVLPKWDLGLDFRYAQNIARDHVLASDIQGVRPETFYKIESLIAYISRRF